MIAPSAFDCVVCDATNIPGATSCASCGSPLEERVGHNDVSGSDAGGSDASGIIAPNRGLEFRALTISATPETSSDALPPNSSLQTGAFVIESVLGQGGFGITYRGRDLKLKRDVAIKEFFPSGCRRSGVAVSLSLTLAADDFAEARAKFGDEARLLARFRHRGIVHVYSVFEENNTAYMVMELLHGQTLSKGLEARGGRLEEAEARAILDDLADALQTVHAEGLLHRDIKPENVIVTDDHRVVLIDFGSAKEVAIGARTQVHSIVVTPGYAPLEQYARRARRGPYTDVYALAATFYFLLSGEAPPAASDRAVGVELTPLQTFNPDLSAHLSNAIERGLEIEIAKRPQSIEEFMALVHGDQSTLGANVTAPQTRQPLSDETLARLQAAILDLPVERLWKHPMEATFTDYIPTPEELLDLRREWAMKRLLDATRPPSPELVKELLDQTRPDLADSGRYTPQFNPAIAAVYTAPIDLNNYQPNGQNLAVSHQSWALQMAQENQKAADAKPPPVNPPAPPNLTQNAHQIKNANGLSLLNVNVLILLGLFGVPFIFVLLHMFSAPRPVSRYQPFPIERPMTPRNIVPAIPYPVARDTHAISQANMSQDATQVVGLDQTKTIRIWDTRSGDVAASLGTFGSEEEFHSIRLSRDARMVLGISHGRTMSKPSYDVRIWDVATNREIWSRSNVPTGDGWTPPAVSFGEVSNFIKMVDAEGNYESNGVYSDALDQRFSLFAKDRLKNDRQRFNPAGEKQVLNMLMFSSRAPRNPSSLVGIVSAKRQGESSASKYRLVVWPDHGLGPATVITEQQVSFTNLGLTSDGGILNHFANGANHKVRLWDRNTGVLRRLWSWRPQRPGKVMCVAAPDGGFIVATQEGNPMRILNVGDGRIRAYNLISQTDWQMRQEFPIISFSPDSKKIALAKFDKHLQIFDLQTRQLWQTGDTDSIGADTVKFSADGAHLVWIDSRDGTMGWLPISQFRKKSTLTPITP